MSNNQKIVYQCRECSYESLQWLGKCPSCGTWNSFEKEQKSNSIKNSRGAEKENQAKPINSLVFSDHNYRYLSGIKEFDRVLGGGVIPGSLILIGGEPGIGKSTLVLQVANQLSKNIGKVLYVTAEESIRQIHLRAQRLSVNTDQLYLLSEVDLDHIIMQIENLKPKIAIIDSIQIIHDHTIASIPGSVNQVKSCTSRLMEIAKQGNVSVIIIGHVTKGGIIAGPKILEHIVDTVLYLEGERFHSFRLLRGIKNRFGPTNELGIFQMENNGLQEVSNPSKMLLSSRTKSIPGTVTTVTFEGSRPLLVEIEALVSSSYLNNSRRMTSGMEYNRILLVIAVLENRLGIKLQFKDIYLNVAGGIKINEPAIDLGIALAILSSAKGIAIDLDTIVFGELGLTGEVRSVSMSERRMMEAKKIGYHKCIVPFDNANQLPLSLDDLNIKGIRSIDEIFDIIKQNDSLS